MEAGYLSAAEYQALVTWLAEKDHALLVLGGYRSFGPDGFRDTPLADALPVDLRGRPALPVGRPVLAGADGGGASAPDL